jgi:hypothetical protein
MNGRYPRSTMSLDFARGLITRPAYGKKIGIKFPQRGPLRRALHVSGKPRSLLAWCVERADMLGPDPHNVEISQTGRSRQHRGYRQLSPTKYLGDPRSQLCPLIQFDVDPVLTSERQACPRLTNALSVPFSDIQLAPYPRHIGYFGPP